LAYVFNKVSGVAFYSRFFVQYDQGAEGLYTVDKTNRFSIALAQIDGILHQWIVAFFTLEGNKTGRIFSVVTRGLVPSTTKISARGKRVFSRRTFEVKRAQAAACASRMSPVKQAASLAAF